MKKTFLLIALFLFANVLFAQNQNSYMLPDLGTPGYSTYVEIMAHVDSLWFFGTEREVRDNTLYLTPSNQTDKEKIQFSPLYISWSGRLISAHAFVQPNLKPTSWKWNEGINIPIDLVKNGVVIGKYDFYVVQPFHIGNITDASAGFVFGEGGLGIRSPRGAMIIDSMVTTLPNVYTVSTKDCDPNTAGNQAYLPFTLISLGKFDVPNISVNANGKNGGVGGGGGGGAFKDFLLLADIIDDMKGGDGFTGGGVGGANVSVVTSNKYSTGGTGSGSNDRSSTSGYYTAGSSLNGVGGACSKAYISVPNEMLYESAGGGTGHPFGLSGKTNRIDDLNMSSGYGGGSGGAQNTNGGNGVYANGTTNPIDGHQHGNIYLMPLAGGSGGASGNPNSIGTLSGYGGGGGGAISISAPIIKINSITANGAEGKKSSSNTCNGGNGSGGAIMLNGKLSTTVASAETSEGNKTIVNAGYVRSTGIANAVNTTNARYYVSEATDTTKYINPRITTKIKISSNEVGTSNLWIKSENTNWREIPVNSGYIELQPAFWISTDTVYYVYMVNSIDMNSDALLYNANPRNILTQSAANVFILRAEVDIPDTLKPSNEGLYALSNVTSCFEDTLCDTWKNGVGGSCTVLKIEIYGDYEDNYSWTTVPVLPALLDNNETMSICIGYNIGADRTLGTKSATIDMYYLTEKGEYKLKRDRISYAIVETFEPTSVDFGSVPVDSKGNSILDVKYLPGHISKLEDAYLTDGTYFSFDNKIIGTILALGKTLPITIFYDAKKTGLHTDTLCLVTSNKSCWDTTYIPIRINVAGITEYDSLIVNNLNFAVCGDSIVIVPEDFFQKIIGDTIVGISEPTYIGGDAILYAVDTNFPIVITDNGLGFGYIFRWKSIGKSIGNKEARIKLYIHKQNGNILEFALIVSFEVIIPVSISPKNIDFGTISVNSNITIPVLLTNSRSDNYTIYSSKLLHNNYSIVKNFNSIVMKNSVDTAKIGLSGSSGKLDDTLEVVIKYNECFDTLKVPITGTLLSLTNFILRISDNVKINPRAKDYPLAIYIKSDADYSAGGKIDSMWIHFDNGLGLFLPKGVDYGKMDTTYYAGQQRIVSIVDIPMPNLKANEEKLLLNIIGDVLLGNADSTEIEFVKNAVVFNNSVEHGDVQFYSGSLSIDICREGGNRLLKTSGAIESQGINPIRTDNIDIKCNVGEVGHYWLEIIDNVGNVTLLKEWDVSSLENTEYNFTINLSAFANGNYYLLLRNNKEQSLNKVILAR